MGFKEFVKARFEGVRAAFWKHADTGIAAFIWIAVLGVLGAAVAQWRDRVQATVTLPTWLALVLALVLASSLAVSALYVLDRYRRRRQPDADLPKRVEMLYGPWYVRVSRELLTDSYLDSGWLPSHQVRITPPLCPRCRAEIIRLDTYGTWQIVGRCSCGAQITGDGRSVSTPLNDFKLEVFKELQRRHRAGLPLKKGTQLVESNEEHAGPRG